MSREVDGDVERLRLLRRLNQAVGRLEAPPASPLVVVDLDAFDANAHELVRRAAGTPVRVATKSLRVPELVRRALAVDGFRGVLAYSLREALWLHGHGVSDDIVLGYPTADRAAMCRLLADHDAARAITLMVDDPEHLDLVDSVRAGARTRVRIAIDVDAGLRMGTNHVGPKRSPLHDPAEVADLAHEVDGRQDFDLVGLMTYEGQVAGVPDAVPGQRARSMVVRRLKQASVHQLAGRRRQIGRALREVAGPLEFFNSGGSGSIETSAADPAVTEVTAGSGLLVPHLFDHYESFVPRPAAYFALPVVRKPSAALATVAGGGLIASGPTGRDRSPLPWAPPDLHLTSLEGAGEVQTPLTGHAAARLRIGDLVWFRHAKGGEPAEHTTSVHLLRGDRIVEEVSTYRGAGSDW